MPQLPTVPAGQRLFLWAGGGVPKIIPIVAPDQAWAAEAVIQERVRSGQPRAEAESCFEWHDRERLLDITELGAPIVASHQPSPVCSNCGVRGELLDGLCCDCYKNRESGQETDAC